MFLLIIYLWLLTILLIAAVQDITSRKISNGLIITGLVGLIGLQIYTQNLQVFSLCVGFGLGLVLWQLKFIGGGDSKLLILVSAAFALDKLALLYTFISLAGAVQALWWRALKKKSNLPYGVAIFIGTMGLLIFKIFS